MATSFEDIPVSEKAFSAEFALYARQIDSKVHPDLETEKRAIRVFKGVAEILGQGDLVTVGSAVDGSKVNVPGDSGDIDVLLVSKCVVLDQSLFDYSERYPGFLYVRGTGLHKKYFRNGQLIDGKYIPVSVLKSLKSRFYGFVKFFVNEKTFPGICRQSGFLNMIRHSAVGMEKMQLDTKPLQSLDLTVEHPENSLSKFMCPMINTLVDLRQSGWELPLESDDDDDQKQMERCDIIKTLYRCIEKNKSKESKLVSCPKDSSKSEKCNPEVTETENIFSKQVSDTSMPYIKNVSDSTQCLVQENSTESWYEKEGRKTEQNKNIDTCSDNCKVSESNKCFLRTFHDKNQSYDESNCQNPQMKEMQLKKLFSEDFVTAFSFDGWPTVADEWLKRTRKWPSDETIESVRQTGCHIVAKRPLLPEMNGDPKNEDHSPEHDAQDPYFRISFSVCELVLSKSLSEPQLLCWRVLKAFQKAYLGSEPKVLASYHWKNVALWLFEETDPSFWTENSVLEGVCRALDFMILFLSIKFVPYYFVRRCNLIDGCRNDLIQEVCTRIIEIRKNPLAYLQNFINSPPAPQQYKVNEDVVSYSLSNDNVSRHFDTMANGLSLTLRQFPQFINSDKDGNRFRFGIQNIMNTMEEIMNESNDPDSAEMKNFKCFKHCWDKMTVSDSFSNILVEITDKLSETVCTGMTDKQTPLVENVIQTFKDLVTEDEESAEPSFKKFEEVVCSIAAMAQNHSSEEKQTKKHGRRKDKYRTSRRHLADEDKQSQVRAGGTQASLGKDIDPRQKDLPRKEMEIDLD